MTITLETLHEYAEASVETERTAHAPEPAIEPDDGDDSADPDAQEAAPAVFPKLRGSRRQVVMLLASSQTGLRPREIVQALGKPDTRSQVETMRALLRRLTADGWLRQLEDMDTIKQKLRLTSLIHSPVTTTDRNRDHSRSSFGAGSASGAEGLDGARAGAGSVGMRGPLDV
ncbi:hypothetical protein [Nonomuraea sp. NPDC001023]|uniref:hypothetical protein n=1 Tax=unclassified Nonomuraea TaxID=2593643 RepID=UPI00331E371B